jgi:hypothetical protein
VGVRKISIPAVEFAGDQVEGGKSLTWLAVRVGAGAAAGFREMPAGAEAEPVEPG